MLNVKYIDRICKQEDNGTQHIHVTPISYGEEIF